MYQKKVKNESLIFEIKSHQEEDRVEEGDGKQSVEVDLPFEDVID